MAELDFTEIVTLIRKEDPRYAGQAYGFVREGLSFCVEAARKREKRAKGQTRQLSPAEVLEGLREFALAQFGPLTATVLASWGIRCCADFGEVVFNLIEYQLCSKSETDRREDFATGYDFQEAFLKPFQPERRRARAERGERALEKGR
ncbi:MAG: hypothetical protein LBR12_03520 [Opitutaceae bacterium]|jgi:uncharacterized repeat protein (TIGR04138 family)|nr:hypothetical protein [Opitutaceae bacterium]